MRRLYRDHTIRLYGDLRSVQYVTPTGAVKTASSLSAARRAIRDHRRNKRRDNEG